MKVPTGGERLTSSNRPRRKPASAFSLTEKGQQIRCDSEADGQSPDERERFAALHAIFRVGTAVPCALILVLKEESHESDLA